ncbi:hypothetical protein EYF80_054241 [Liparis tanakae]|uniref:Uncharacterized protein n=1 Tax=Liparis tanakae TaxID=230148 RepID=A0A4Z2F363_9TELE|nr:hypothetical protein EYF80_054241 [Liparis tanakae]
MLRSRASRGGGGRLPLVMVLRAAEEAGPLARTTATPQRPWPDDKEKMLSASASPPGTPSQAAAVHAPRSSDGSITSCGRLESPRDGQGTTHPLWPTGETDIELHIRCGRLESRTVNYTSAVADWRDGH